jgi:F0F1-type ATP synthase epsilon subunit
MFEVNIISEYRTLFQGKAQRVIVPGLEGVFEVLRFHHPLISLLLPGKVVVDQAVFPIVRGVVQVTYEGVTAIVEEPAQGQLK